MIKVESALYIILSLRNREGLVLFQRFGAQLLEDHGEYVHGKFVYEVINIEVYEVGYSFEDLSTTDWIEPLELSEDLDELKVCKRILEERTVSKERIQTERCACF